jgi:lysophospholipase L1-like esterase
MIIFTFGASTTVGVREGVTSDQTYSAQLENLLRSQGMETRVVIKGQGGENTNGGLQRLPEVLSLQPDYLTIMYGINDAAVDAGNDEPRVSLTEYSNNLESMIALANAAGVRPLLLTINPMCSFGITEKLYGSREPYLSKGINFLTQQYAETMKRVGEKLNVPVIDVYAEFFKRAPKGDTSTFFTDGMHPNPAGHTIIAELLAGYFLG